MVVEFRVGGCLTELQDLGGRRQLREGVLLDDVYISGGNSATGIDIIAEVRGCYRLERLRFTQIGVATGDDSAGVDVTNQNTHCRGDVAQVTGGVVHVT